MLSWNSTAEYRYTRSRVCVGGVNRCLTVGSGEGRVMVLVSGRMWPGTFKALFVIPSDNVYSYAHSVYSVQ